MISCMNRWQSPLMPRIGSTMPGWKLLTSFLMMIQMVISQFEGLGEEDLEDLEEEVPRSVRRGSGGDAVIHGPEGLVFIKPI